MRKLGLSDLLKLEDYAAQRTAWRQKLLTHKKARTVHLGPHMTLIFEDRLTIQYQIQEMLRIERIFERAAIEEELAAYNPLIPDGNNWKATCLIEYEDELERRRALAELRGIEHRIWLQIADRPRDFAIADEDLERSDEKKTSSVHFLRFEFAPAALAALRAGAAVQLGVDHPSYRHQLTLAEPQRQALLADLQYG